MSIEHDLERWETGMASSEELLRAYPEEDLGGLLGLHRRMTAIATAPASYDEGALQGFLASLPDRARPRRRGRSLLLAVAAVLLTASMAVAMPGIRDGVTAITHSVGRLFGIGSPPATGPSDRGPAAPPTDGSTGDPGDGQGGSGTVDDNVGTGGGGGGGGSEDDGTHGGATTDGDDADDDGTDAPDEDGSSDDEPADDEPADDEPADEDDPTPDEEGGSGDSSSDEEPSGGEADEGGDDSGS